MNRTDRPPRRRWVLALSRALLALYPSDFRRRFGDDVVCAIEASVEAGVPARRIVMDALRTLFQAWSNRLRTRGGGGGFGAGWSWDIRLAFRSIVRDPLYSSLVVVTLALAIGANAAVFDVAWSVLVRSLPYGDPERVVAVDPSPVRLTGTGFGVSSTLADLPQVESATAYTAGGRASLGASAGAAEASVTQVTGSFFDVLGVSMRLGRGLSHAPDGDLVAVLSDGLWRRAFGSDPGIIGRTIQLSGNAVVVAGVAPPGVDVPAGTDVWLTYPLVPVFYGAASGAEVITRLRSPELIAETRDAHVMRLSDDWSSRGDELPARYREVEFTPLRASLVGPVREALITLLAAASLVLLLGCVNLAGVTLARRSARAGELAVRRALGAGRTGLVRMMMTESLVLAVLAGPPAALLLVWGRVTLRGLLPGGLPGLGAAGGPGMMAVAFVVGATLVAGIAVGILPALSALAESSGMGVAGRLRERRRRLHPALVVTEIALAVLLVIGAGLLGRSLVALRAVPLGYDLEHVLTFEVRLPESSYGGEEAWRGYADGLTERLSAIPGVAAVGVASRLPLGEGMGSSYRVWPDAVTESDSTASGSVVWATSHFFDAFGIPLVAGGTFMAGDRHSVLMSRALALSLFGRVDVIGESIRMRSSMRRDPELMTIAGVTGDTRMFGYETDLSRVLYLPFEARPVPWLAFAIRAAGDPAALAGDVRTAVSTADASVAPFRMATTEATASEALATRSALTLAAIVFGSAALLLSVLGTYGLLAQSVAGRRRELGVRMAIGANAPDVIRMVINEAARLAATGAAVGLLAALALTRLLDSLLWNTGTTDPLTFAAVPLLVLLAALAAAAIPARRATAIDPAQTLRSD